MSGSLNFPPFLGFLRTACPLPSSCPLVFFPCRAFRVLDFAYLGSFLPNILLPFQRFSLPNIFLSKNSRIPSPLLSSKVFPPCSPWIFFSRNPRQVSHSQMSSSKVSLTYLLLLDTGVIILFLPHSLDPGTT